jgi:chromosomal replication initiator protein
MTKDCVAVWNECLNVIRDVVPEQSYKTWFMPIKPVSLAEKILTIQVPTRFFYEWLEEHYVGVLKKAIDKAIGNDARLEYILAVEKERFPESITKLGTQNKQEDLFPGKKNEQVRYAPIAPVKSGKKEAEEAEENNLSDRFTFETFIEGDCNRLARSTGFAVAQNPGVSAFNPLVIFGGVGLGKTHLVQAIGNAIRLKHPEKKVLYLSAEQFTTLYVESVKDNQVQKFMSKYLKLDTLIIDDIQFLANKEKTQEVFFHIFNHLHQLRKQIILTSDCPPKDIQVQDRLLSRFKWGLTTDLLLPDVKTREAIVRAKLASTNFRVKDEIIRFFAENVDTNIRELEGCVNTLVAQVSIMRETPTIDLAQSVIVKIVSNERKKEVSIEEIEQIVCTVFNLSSQELQSKSRKANIAAARMTAMYFANQLTDMPLKAVGWYFGKRDHSTVVHAIKTVEAKKSCTADYTHLIDEIKRLLDDKNHATTAR